MENKKIRSCINLTKGLGFNENTFFRTKIVVVLDSNKILTDRILRREDIRSKHIKIIINSVKNIEQNRL